ncbi:hypothetical protein [Kitasatospora sp. NPDC001547]|uniref:hypothetical protein n=1 Tax=Kitasatospora sp. NPDC001547 TaxID=3364015 RepID=UPI0036AE04C4
MILDAITADLRSRVRRACGGDHADRPGRTWCERAAPRRLHQAAPRPATLHELRTALSRYGLLGDREQFEQTLAAALDASPSGLHQVPLLPAHRAVADVTTHLTESCPHLAYPAHLAAEARALL